MSNERVNVSKGLLDDLSDSVQALTGTAENMSIQEMSNAVSAKANESFELIETIVLTEEVSVVERTKEPNGTDYNFKELYVELTFPNRTKLEKTVPIYALNIAPFLKGSIYYGARPYIMRMDVGISPPVSHIANARFYLRFRNGMLRTSCTYGNTGEYSNRGGFIDSNMDILSKKSINGFHIGIDKSVFPVAATPTIKIYGIRA